MTLGLEETVFTVSEGGQVEVCAVVVAGQLGRTVIATLSTANGNATGMYSGVLYIANDCCAIVYMACT